MVYAEANWGRMESGTPTQGFYEAGALFDVGVYPLTIATAMFGPARRVTAFGGVVMPDAGPSRRPVHGHHAGLRDRAIELADDMVIRLTANFYVTGSRQRAWSSTATTAPRHRQLAGLPRSGELHAIRR